MHGVEIREIAPSSIDSINKMCVMPRSSYEAALAALKESADAHWQAAAMGQRCLELSWRDASPSAA